MVRTIFLTNDKDQNSAASEMPATSTVAYAVIVPFVIETRTVLKLVRLNVSLFKSSSGPLVPCMAIAPG